MAQSGKGKSAAMSSDYEKCVAAAAFAQRSHLSRRALYHCNYCQRDISASVRIKCAVCRDFDLCLGCFAAGVFNCL
jgi:ABC-type ATPase with predicted acetyltransferase domain